MRVSPVSFYLLVALAGLAVIPDRAAAAEKPLTGKAVADFEPLDQAVLRFMDRVRAQAATVAVSRDGKLLYSRGYGWRDAKRQTPTPPDALMRIASVSKPITAAEVRLLVRDGKLTLGTKAFPLLKLKPYNGTWGDKRLNDITVRHLLEHRGGWDSAKAFDPMFGTADVEKALKLSKPATPVNVIEYMLAQPLQFAPGEREAYSNFGYCVLGRVVEHAAGRPYGEAVARDLFRPLGLTDIKLGRSAARNRDPREVCYPVADDAYSVEVLDAAGGWIASAPALCRFLDAYWLNGEPRRGGCRELLFFGSLPGTTAMVRQRTDGLNVAVLLNNRRDEHFEADDALLRNSVDAALDRYSKAANPAAFAAVWEKADKRAWAARHDLNADEFQKAFDQFTKDGYRLTWISGYGAGCAVRYAAVWEKADKREWVARLDLSAADYQKALDHYAKDGFQPTCVSGYQQGGEARYAAVWEKRDGPKWATRHGLSADEYQKAIDEFRKDGYRPTCVSGYEVAGKVRYAAIWDKADKPAWASRHGLSAAEYQKAIDELGKAGYRPTCVSGYDDGGQVRYAAVWEKRETPAWVARHGLSAADYQKAFDQYQKEGYRPVCVNGYPAPSRP